MIKLYYKNCTSSRNSILWFSKYGIAVEMKDIRELERQDLFELLSLTNEGFSSIVKYSGKSSINTQHMLNQLFELSFNQAVDFLLQHTELLRGPIIFGNKKYLIGYNEDDIRVFLPKKYRRYTLKVSNMS